MMKSQPEFTFPYLEDISAFPHLFALSSPHFPAFLAADFTAIESSAIRALARALVNAGCVYFCTWGPDCERAHDIIDEVCFYIVPPIMTTRHAKETLEQALWFFAFNAIPDSRYAGTATNALAISIENTGWQQLINNRLSNLEELNHNIVNGP